MLNFDVIVKCDITGSMKASIDAINSGVPSFLTQMCLMGLNVARCATVADFDASSKNSKQGGWMIQPRNQTLADTKEFLKNNFVLGGGGGFPEAYRTAFNMILNIFRSEKSDNIPIVILFCDAIPHMEPLDSEGILEEAFLKKNNMITSWTKLCDEFKNEGIKVFTIITNNASRCAPIWEQMGSIIIMNRNSANLIEKALFCLFDILTGQPFEEPKSSEFIFSKTIKPLTTLDLKLIINEADPMIVTSAFDALLDTNDPKKIMYLTTNPILGKFWRLICGKFKYVHDGRYALICNRIMDKFSICKVKLSSNDQAIINKWLEESNMNLAEIRDILSKFNTDVSTNNLILLPEFVGSMDQHEVLKLGREGQFKSLAIIVASLTLSSEPYKLPSDEKAHVNFLPMDIENLTTFFSLIANLISPGLMFSKTDTLMLAILALSNEFIKDKAHTYLFNNKGSWINWDRDQDGKQCFPQFWSLNFMRLLKLVPDDLLTDAEIHFRNKYLRIAKIVSNHSINLTITAPLMIPKLRSGRTWKRMCTYCSQKRCFTLFSGKSDKCIMCTIAPNTNIVFYKDTSKICEESDQNTSWAQCSKCTVNYSVILKDCLKIDPKCHGCRVQNPLPYVECRLCLHKYISLDGSAEKALQSEFHSELDPDKRTIIQSATDAGEFICPRCVEFPYSMVNDYEVKINELIRENPALQSMIPITPYLSMMDTSTPLWQRVLKCNESESASAPPILTYNGYTIHNSTIVAQTMMTQLIDHSGYDSCSMCASDVSVRNIELACGDCRNRICNSCVQHWYGQTKVGHLVTHGQCICPFCKNPPKFSIIRRLDLCKVRNLRTTKSNKGVTCEWDSHIVYGLCCSCFNLKPAFPRECARTTELPHITNFKCEECKIHPSLLDEAESVDKLLTKNCPECNILTEKNGGCNHITCHCGTHWCWSCCSNTDSDGTPLDERTIYDHMISCDGIFSGI